MDLRTHRGEYGLDGQPWGLASLGALSTILFGVGTHHRRVGRSVLGVVELASSFALLVNIALYLHATRRGKFEVWAELLEDLELRGDELILDMGCGRGAVLAMAAKLVPNGRGFGLDRWTSDQSGNRPSATQRNLRAEGVLDRCALTTGDMVALPYQSCSFDLVLSSLAIHNIDETHRRTSRRSLALNEAVRVLKPGGRLLVVDLVWVRHYAKHLATRGMSEISQRPLGWRVWYGPPGARLVTANRSGSCS